MSNYWLTTDGDSSMAEGTLTVHTVVGRTTGHGPERYAPALCGALPMHGWYDDYDDRDGGPLCRACSQVHRQLTGMP